MKINFFNHPALTTTIPAQFVKNLGVKFNQCILERYDKVNFKITFEDQIIIGENSDQSLISLKLNQWLENKIKKKPISMDMDT